MTSTDPQPPQPLALADQLIISYLTAPRHYERACALLADLRARYRSILQLTSDGLYAYEAGVEA